MSGLRILFFGRLGEIAGAREVQRTPPAEVRSLADLRNWLASGDPMLGDALVREGVRVAVNHEIVRDASRILAAGDEIAFMSPLSGG
jgi:molybdopterin synthase sulfur carrier subunit